MVEKSNDLSSPSGVSGQQANRSSIAGQTADQLRDHANDAAGKVQDAKGQASSALNDLNDKASDLLGSAKGMASEAGGRVTDALESQKAAGTDRVKGISDAIRRAAGELEHELPPAATYIKRAADEIDMMADAIKRRDVRQIVQDVQGFAQRQPAAFLGATILGGFAVVRLLRTPSTTHPAPAHGTALVATRPAPVATATTRYGGGIPGGESTRTPGFATDEANLSPRMK